jgi:hypothetical protein
MLAGVAALAGQVAPSQAGYGDAANVFGKVTNKSGRSRQQQQGTLGLQDSISKYRSELLSLFHLISNRLMSVKQA